MMMIHQEGRIQEPNPLRNSCEMQDFKKIPALKEM